MMILGSMLGWMREGAQVLVLTLSAILFGASGGGASLASPVGDAVEDKGRRKAAVAVAERIDGVLSEVRGSVVQLRSDALQLMGDYDWTADQLGARFTEFDRETAAASSKLIILRAELKAQMTAEEWAAVFAELEERFEARAGG